VLKEASQRPDVILSIAAGEGVFYGSKIEYSVKDVMARVWPRGIMQVDLPGATLCHSLRLFSLAWPAK